MELIANFKRNRAIKSYIKKLPSLLAKDYGKSKTYTPKQVKRTIERSGLSVTDACYGIAMFSSREAFDQYHQETGESCNYDSMRCEIADKHFGGNSEFEISDIASASSSYGGGFDDGGFADAGGGDGGGSD
ncbi:MAG: hypothetical protein OEY52_16565 [Gammaproteobacteria bacterium]|nr:hypothetical protein [Gammaproteobacteria bacterium]